MTRYTTLKLENIICNDDQAVANSIDTSDSILSQHNKDFSYITDQFVELPKQTVDHYWLTKKEHAKRILCLIAKSDYELISFKKKQLNDKLSGN